MLKCTWLNICFERVLEEIDINRVVIDDFDCIDRDF